MHVVARGALIGGGVGAVLAAVRRSEPGSGTAGRYLKSVAEGAVAGAGVALLLDRRLRTRAVGLVAETAPELAETVVELATEAWDAARPRLVELAELARDRATELRAG
jgi:hypothetical protein